MNNSELFNCRMIASFPFTLMSLSKKTLSQMALQLILWRMADVAQLVEPRIVVPVVAGSSPVVRPNKDG